METVIELALEMRASMEAEFGPFPEDSLALEAWTCQHGLTHANWYVKEVMHELDLCAPSFASRQAI